jgi:hypothetical protein
MLCYVIVCFLEGFDDLRYMRALLSAISVCYKEFGLYESITAASRSVFLCSPEGLSDTKLPWLQSNVLLSPILKFVILQLTLLEDKQLSAASSVELVQTIIKWNSIAYLTQITFAEMSDLYFDQLNRCSSSNGPNGKRFKKGTSFDASSLVSDVDAKSEKPSPCLREFIGIISNIICTHFPCLGERQEVLEEASVVSILQRFLSFSRTIVQLMRKMRCVKFVHISNTTPYAENEIEQILDIDFSEDAVRISLTRAIDYWLMQLKTAYQCEFRDLNGAEMSSRFEECFIESRILATLLKHAEFRYPILSKAKLVNLPKSYTSLHGSITNSCDFDYPALCLSCGKILDAGSRHNAFQ